MLRVLGVDLRQAADRRVADIVGTRDLDQRLTTFAAFDRLATLMNR
jgi:hypothetical protein